LRTGRYLLGIVDDRMGSETRGLQLGRAGLSFGRGRGGALVCVLQFLSLGNKLRGEIFDLSYLVAVDVLGGLEVDLGKRYLGLEGYYALVLDVQRDPDDGHRDSDAYVEVLPRELLDHVKT
jgi:hypothetical protein